MFINFHENKKAVSLRCNKRLELNFLLLFIASFVLAGCAATAQHTSGKKYLDRYSELGYAGAPSGDKSGEEKWEQSDIDAMVRNIAAVEPHFPMPARIGIAKINGYRGQLIPIPEDEYEHWKKLAESLGPKVGEFIPVNPLIAELVTPSKQTAKARLSE